MKIILILLGVLFLLTFVSAVVCTDSFSSTQNIITLCGYCSENNGSVCSASVNCNFTIYYSNFTPYAKNLNATNNLDGSFTYNIVQTGGNLTDGLYIGELYCGARSRDDLSFTVGTTKENLFIGGSSTFNVVNGQINITRIQDKIPKDINSYWNYWGNKLSKNYGKWIILLLLLIIIFFQETAAMIILLIFELFGNYDFIDLKEAFIYYGKEIGGTHSTFGLIIFIILFIFIVFIREVFSLIALIKKSRNKLKFKDKF